MQMLNRLEKRNSNDLRKCELFNGKPVVGRKLTWGRCHKQNLEKHSYASLFLKDLGNKYTYKINQNI